MLSFYPEQALVQLEFNKIQQLLLKHCRTELARHHATELRFHTRVDYVACTLDQTLEYKSALTGSGGFPNDFTQNLGSALKLLQLTGASLDGLTLLALGKMTLSVKDILAWMKQHGEWYPELRKLTEGVIYENNIVRIITEIIDDQGNVRDTASRELIRIRTDLDTLRQQLRKTFESVLRKLNKQGYLADIAESFLNGRRTVAVLAEYKRIVKGIFHGESDSQKTVFIEPEETIGLNNELAALELAERKEIQRILAKATADLAVHHSQLEQYYQFIGLLDFIRAKALLAQDLNAHKPRLTSHPTINLIAAYHPLLLLHNLAAGKPTHPLTVSLDRKDRILMVSGPNAGGKTVSMKTVGLLQVMLQAGLLVPVDPQSEMGIFKQIMVHIGDTQSIENELSTYSAHLRDMKYFLEFAHGKTLFFIDELGSGSDPGLGGAFAEAIVEQLAAKKALGIITTHYLNLKVMAGKVPGIINGAMSFDEEHLEPLYQLIVGKPGSSYTFAIAQRSRLPQQVIDRARQLTDRGHFKLDKVLHKAEQQSVKLDDQEKRLERLTHQNDQLKAKYESLIDKEQLRQHFATLKLQNKIKKEELDYLRDTERKFKQIILDWKKSEDKQGVIQAAEKLLFRRKQLQQNEIASKKADKKYTLTGKLAAVGDLVRNVHNHQVGRITELRGKKAVVKIGNMPFTVNLVDWIGVEARNGK